MRRAAAVLVALVALSGCGDANDFNTDRAGFIATGRTPAQRAILTSIADYRLTKNEALACSLVTRHFLSGRFEGTIDNCEQVQREASRHLPDTAAVLSVSGASARVHVNEPTATESIYSMRREGGTWKIDDITEP